MKFKTRFSALLVALILVITSLSACTGGQLPGGDLPLMPGENGGGDSTTDVPGSDGDQPGSGSNKPGNGGGSGDADLPPEGDNEFEEPDFGDEFASDPYIGVNKAEFYENYKPAVCYQDALYRSEHFLMSGSIEEQDQAPTVSGYQPTEGGLFIRNTSAIFREDGNAYIVLDAYGNEAFRVYRGGAYVTLEEVAAYVYAFGEIPANYTSKKSGKPSANPWGIYLRLNHSMFSGDTSRYPYEPVLPDISGCGGELQYYEMDIGTTGTDCDPSYKPTAYNNGSKITRGAARIVYTRYDRNGDHIIDPNERYLFYTYNHYNDFQEYLNYEGGWGEIFGNITGGGSISSKYDYNPTDYVKTVRKDFSVKGAREELILFIPEAAVFSYNRRKAA